MCSHPGNHIYQYIQTRYQYNIQVVCTFRSGAGCIKMYLTHRTSGVLPGVYHDFDCTFHIIIIND